jgi:hypothetical protein
MTTEQPITLLVDLKWGMARLTYNTRVPNLCICVPSELALDSGFVPASSVTVYSEKSLLALRDALNAAFPPGGNSPINTGLDK